MPGTFEPRLTAALIGLALAAPGGTLAAAPRASCPTPVAADEPPCNPALAQSPWAMAHRGSYEQHSSPWAGPAPGQPIAYEHTDVEGVPLVLMFSAPYPDGGIVAWASVIGTRTRLVKLDHASGRVLSSYVAGEDQAGQGGGAVAASGVYAVLDRDNHVIVGRDRFLEVYGDALPGERSSPIEQLRRFPLPDGATCRASDRLVGLNMLHDGMVAFATQQGVIGVIPRRPERMGADNIEVLSLNGERCADRALPDDELERISNSIAIDEQGGIYAVTSRAMYKVRWDGDGLSREWRTPYQTGGGEGGARVGEGSGSTPALVGGPDSRDRFVVITDGQKLMHLVLFWRRDGRIACEVPIRFGDPQATDSVSEQSVLVRGYGTVVVNNHLRMDEVFAQLPPQLRLYSNLAAQDPANAPYGVERIDWDPGTRTCRSRWANRDVSIPNGVPTMSSATGLVYGIGQRQGIWGLEGLDFDTGERKLWRPTSPEPTENSFFAAATIGPEGTLYSGTFLGITAFRPPPAPGPALERRLLRLGLRVRRGSCTRARARVRGSDIGQVRRAVFVVGRRRVARDGRAPFSRRIPVGRRRVVRVRLALSDGGLVTLRRRVRACAS
jgi:hypothetical protein